MPIYHTGKIIQILKKEILSIFGRALLPAFWGLKNYIRPVKHGGRIIAQTIQGRIALLKKDIAGSAPYTTDMPPFNPQFTYFQVAKR
jgi:hypothetical protein